MHENNYVHRDLHPGNIGVCFTKQKYFEINNHKIATHGYLYKIIDYGRVLNKNDINNTTEKKEFDIAINSEIRDLKYLFIKSQTWKYIGDNKIEILDFKNHYKLFKQTDEYDIIKEYTNIESDQMFLYEILYPEEYYKLLMKKKYKYFPIKLRIPIEDIIYFVRCGNDHMKIIKYFVSRINYYDK
jgi:serine/threonine protein kinase